MRIFIYALEKVASVNGMSRDRPGFFQSWQHGTIARRVAFLYGVLKDPTAEPRFQRRVALVKWGLIAALGAALAILVAVVPLPSNGPKPTPDRPPAAVEDHVPAIRPASARAAARLNPSAEPHLVLFPMKI